MNEPKTEIHIHIQNLVGEMRVSNPGRKIKIDFSIINEIEEPVQEDLAEIIKTVMDRVLSQAAETAHPQV